MKKIIMIIFIFLVTMTNYDISHGDVLKGDDAYNIFRIVDYKNIKYSIDKSTTNKYNNHTDAWNNAIKDFSKETFNEITFEPSTSSESKIIMTSVNSSKEEWLGLSTTYISTDSNGVSKVVESHNFLNNYTINYFNLSKQQINEVALHELGHSFGLKHQPQEYEYKTIMIPYFTISKESTGKLKNIDKYNLIHYYSSGNDWNEHWAADNINNAINKGWIDKTSYFRPDESITRAELVEMINRKFKLNRYSGKVFEDTIYHWAKDEIDIAFTNGVCIGRSEYEFSPDDYITRQESAKMLANYMKLTDKNHDKIKLYSDYLDIDNWAIDEFEAIVENGYIKGTTEKLLLPKGNLSRAEALVILSRIE